MDISSILSLDCTRSAVHGSSKKRVLEMASELAAKHLPDHGCKMIFESILDREKKGSTGIGNGIAIPHGRISNASKAVAVLLQCDEPIAFDAIDNQPVDLIFALLVPEQSCQEHLKTLSAIAAKLSDKQILKKLRCADNDQELYEIITHP
ncbi:PTS IIA-like nitrogen regulatory protein PtsN [Corallincola platygyrae]|uniref:PTS IIA-like nitrogen regulatory protein PtsN n=1 Tax=Corallincola platygyrae TaxID=1193278 RepID=A0ABW4XRP4_9GAMM